MNDDVDRIKLELLEAYEDGASIDIADWAERWPMHRRELIDYWMWLSNTPHVSSLDQERSLEGADEIARNAAREACLAVSFGPQWLEQAVDADLAADEDLGSECARLRATPYQFRGKATKQFRKAVVYAWIVHELQPRRECVTRLAAQKVAFMLERALSLGLFTEHSEKPLGPYDHKARYIDAEPIAARSGWICVKGSDLKPGQATPEFERYLERYVRSRGIAQRLIDRFAQLSDDNLETWATLSWAGHALTAGGEAVTPDSLRGFLEQTPAWRAKLRRNNFAPAKIAEALTRLTRLRLCGS